MRHHLSLPSLLTVGALGLAACGEQATGPNTAVDKPTAPQLAVTSNTWLTRRDMPLELLNQVSATVPNAQGQSVVYVMGGHKASNYIPMGEVRAYNVATNTWTSKRDMPGARKEMNGAGVIDGKIYITGGITGKSQPSASLFVYDAASDTWTQKRDMPAPGHRGMTAVSGGKLYVVTFRKFLPWEAIPDFFRYDPATDSWTTLPSPTAYPLMNAGGGVINKKLYLNAQDPGTNQVVLEYNLITNQWTQKRPWSSETCVPDYYCGLSGPTVVMRSHLYVIGEETQPSSTPGVFIYDPVSDTWKGKPLLTTFNSWVGELTAARVFVNGQSRVEMIGGLRPGNNQQYIP
jgi:N-acetylneuraminic acid mutarotase